MFRRYPYWGWLTFSLLLWCINGYYFEMHRKAIQPENLSRVVANDLKRRIATFNGFISESDITRRMLTDSLTESESRHVNGLPFFIYGYENDTLKFWNTNTIIGAYNDSAVGKTIVLHNEQGIFIEKSLRPRSLGAHVKLVVLFPLVVLYPLENDYLRSHFVASSHIPVNTKIVVSEGVPGNAYPVALEGDKPLFYLQFNPQDIQKWIPDQLFIAMLIAALLASVSWIQLMVIHLTRKKSPLTGFIVTLAIIISFRLLFLTYGLPFNLDGLTLFDPSLYASSKLLSSLGDLLINTMCFLWIVVFVTRHTPYKTYFDKLRKKPIRNIVAVTLVVLMIVFVFLFVDIIRSLVLDSNISFDVSHFYAINIYTILGLLIIGGIAGISSVIIYLFNLQLRKLIKRNWVKYLLIAAAALVIVSFVGANHDKGVQHYAFEWWFYWALSVWALLFIILLDLRNFGLVSDLFEPHMIFWAIFICVFCTAILQHFNQIKEQETRIAFVKSKLSTYRDYELETTFERVGNNISQDKGLKNFFYRPSTGSRKLLNQRFYSQYLVGPALNKYQPTLYLYDANKHGLFNRDTIDYKTLADEKSESESTYSPLLFFKEGLHERHYYLAHIPIYSDSINQVVGYAVVDLDKKKQFSETVNSELLQPVASKSNSHDNEYAYAIYVNNRLISQNNGYPFTIYLANDTLKKDQEYAFHTNNDVSELYYRVADKRTVVVVHYHSFTIETISLFSYLFVIEVLLAAIIMLYQLYLTYFTNKADSGKLIKFTLRRRVHFSMLTVVLVSFIFIGGVTIFFFTNQYRNSNSDKLLSAIEVAKQSVQSYFNRENAYSSDSTFDSVCRSAKFKDYIISLANGQKIDINIFDGEGELVNTSQEDIYNKGLISHMIRPEAYYELDALGKSLVIQNEKVAGLSYLSAYESIRNERGVNAGYINVPFFSSEKDLNFQISNIVVTLINLYAFIFLLSSVITVFITRWITKSFTIIIQQFGRLNLQQNERITWPYDDEIGLLVVEYNKMVNKVEENAALLAQSERESAWREMARQVAHEIKNPLTPMKLNIQYLQQAMRNDAPNLKELMDRVSHSIIEQIDNLSYIASEFSNFAKMPEARPENLELGELLVKATELYINDEHVKVTINKSAESLHVFSDRSQILRVINNLLENAKQAIPQDRRGNIEVSLRRENDDAVISVSDNGEGVSDEVAKKIFQPYFTTKTSGTGLGLAMTKKILEFWKGAIWFETKQGEGTIFHIRLPLVRE